VSCPGIIRHCIVRLRICDHRAACIQQEVGTSLLLELNAKARDEVECIATEMFCIPPSVLLFLNQLRALSIDKRVVRDDDDDEGEPRTSTRTMRREDLGSGIVVLHDNSATTRWRLTRRAVQCDASTPARGAAGYDVGSTTEIVIAMRMEPDHTARCPVFTFLPVEDFGFRFLLQANFQLTSSRESIQHNSAWNQWLRDAVPDLFVEAFILAQTSEQPDTRISTTELLRMVPIERDLRGFFKPVAQRVHKQLRRTKCIPVDRDVGDGDSHDLEVPSRVVIAADAIRELVPPALLLKLSDKRYLREGVEVLPEVAADLGIETFGVPELVKLCQAASEQEGVLEDQKVGWIAAMLVLIYKTCGDGSHRNTAALGTALEQLKAIPLLPLQGNPRSFACARSKVYRISELFAHSVTDDAVRRVVSEVTVLDEALFESVDRLSHPVLAHMIDGLGCTAINLNDLVRAHIIPRLQEDQYNLSREQVCTYLRCLQVYATQTRGAGGSVPLHLETTLLPVCKLSANNKWVDAGCVRVVCGDPSATPVHFPPACFPRKHDWVMRLTTAARKGGWITVDCNAAFGTIPQCTDGLFQMLKTLGVTQFVTPRKVDVNVQDPTDPTWALHRNRLKLDSFHVNDYTCDEWRDTLPQLVQTALPTATSSTHALPVSTDVHSSMVARFLTLMDTWQASGYTKYLMSTACASGAAVAPQFAPTQAMQSGARDVRSSSEPSTFAQELRNLPWVPVEPLQNEHNEDGDTTFSTSRPKHVYIPTKVAKGLFGPLVNFLDGTVDAALQAHPQKATILTDLSLRSVDRSSSGLSLQILAVLNEWAIRDPADVLAHADGKHVRPPLYPMSRSEEISSDTVV
jgi:hypothetical protein